MNIETRLLRLERSNRSLKIACSALAIALGSVFVLAATEKKDEVAAVIRARRIQVVDERGRTGIDINALGGAGSLVLFNADDPAKNQIKVFLGAGETGIIDVYGHNNSKTELKGDPTYLLDKAGGF